MDGVIALIALVVCVVCGLAAPEQYVKGWIGRAHFLAIASFSAFCVFIIIVL